MHLSLVLIQGDVRTRILSILPEIGHWQTGPMARNLRGLQVWAAVERMSDEASGPRDFVRVGVHRGWTVLSDESGRIIDNPHAWSDWAQQHDVRVLAAYADPAADMCAFALFGPQGRERAVARCGDDMHTVGEPLDIESSFASSSSMEAGDLVLLLDALGVDFGQLNASTQYTILETLAAENPPPEYCPSHLLSAREAFGSGLSAGGRA